MYVGSGLSSVVSVSITTSFTVYNSMSRRIAHEMVTKFGCKQGFVVNSA